MTDAPTPALTDRYAAWLKLLSESDRDFARARHAEIVELRRREPERPERGELYSLGPLPHSTQRTRLPRSPRPLKWRTRTRPKSAGRSRPLNGRAMNGSSTTKRGTRPRTKRKGDTVTVAEKKELRQLRADLATLTRAVVPHVNTSRELLEIVERYSPESPEVRPHRAPESRRKVAV